MICSATSEPQLKAIAGEIEDATERGPWGSRSGRRWISGKPMDRARLPAGGGAHLPPRQARAFTAWKISGATLRRVAWETVRERLFPAGALKHAFSPAHQLSGMQSNARTEPLLINFGWRGLARAPAGFMPSNSTSKISVALGAISGPARISISQARRNEELIL